MGDALISAEQPTRVRPGLPRAGSPQSSSHGPQGQDIRWQEPTWARCAAWPTCAQGSFSSPWEISSKGQMWHGGARSVDMVGMGWWLDLILEIYSNFKDSMIPWNTFQVLAQQGAHTWVPCTAFAACRQLQPQPGWLVIPEHSRELYVRSSR